MPTPAELLLVAHQMQAAQDEGRQIAPLTSAFSDFDVDSGYAVADLIHRARVHSGALPVGRKIGFTNADMWSRYGVREPVWAYVYDSTVVQMTTARETCGIGRFAEPKIEPEIIFHFHTAPPTGGDLAAILACIDWVAQGFEIVQSHFPGWKFLAADTVADGALHGRLLVGERQAIARLEPALATALERFSLSLSCDDVLREIGTGSNVLGSPLLAIAHLISVLAKQPDYAPLQANELVTTGTITTAHSIYPGQTWHSEVQGIALPDIRVEFTE